MLYGGPSNFTDKTMKNFHEEKSCYAQDWSKIIKKISGSIPDRKFKGHIEVISPSTDPQSQAYLVKVFIENPKQIIKPGMFTDVLFTKKKVDNALVIPLEAVVNLESDPYVYVLKNNKAVKTPVTTGINNNQEIQIISGLSKESKVIYKGQSLLKPGQGVEVVE